MKPLDPRLLRRARGARVFLAASVVIGVVSGVLIIAQAVLLAHGIAGVVLHSGGVGAVAWGLGAVVVGRALLVWAQEVVAQRAAAAVKSTLRRHVLEHSLKLGPVWLSGERSSALTALLTKGLDDLDPYFARYLPQLVLACLVPAAVLGTVAAADWLSAVIIAATLPLIPLFGALVGMQTRARSQRQWQLLARLGGHFLDVVEGLPTLKVFGRAKPQAEVIAEATAGYRKATMATLRVAFLSAFVLEIAAALATALVAVEVGLRLLAGHLSYQTALLVLLLTPEAYLPLRAVGLHFHASMEGAAAAGRACSILETPVPAVPAAPAGRPQPVDLRRDSITLESVSLAYPGRDRPALDRVSVTIAPGERIAVTGPSGAGKSSLLALLLQFTTPTGGRITAGQADLATVPPEEWRRQVAWVPQRPYLLPGTVASNIALGQPDATPADIARAAGLAGATGFIEALPDGYATPLGEQGLRLSAGQRQRIALARAFLRDAPLLLLDEPTAHLDPLVAQQILAAIETLMAGRTVLLVTHRHAWQGGASRVLCLDQGRLAGPAQDRRASGPALAVTP